MDENHFDLKNIISGPKLVSDRILIVGEPKIGKSTFASKFPNHLVLDIDGGSEQIGSTRTPNVIKTLNEFENWVNAIGGGEHTYETIIIDTVDGLETLIRDALCQEHGYETVEKFPFGTGNPALCKRFQEILKNLDFLRTKRNLNIVFLSHSTVKKVLTLDGEEYERMIPNLYWKEGKAQTCVGILLDFCDVIACAKHKPITKMVGSNELTKKSIAFSSNRVLSIDATNPSDVGASRYKLPTELPLDGELFLEELTKAKQLTIKNNEQ